MTPRTRTLAAAVAALLLAGCGGGGVGSGSPGGTIPAAPVPTAAPSTAPASSAFSISPSYVVFDTPSSPAQQFQVSSSTPGAAAPTLDATTCGGVVSLSGGGATLPETYTVAPNAATSGGGCSLIFSQGYAVATLPIAVRFDGNNNGGYFGPQTLTASPASLSFAAAGAAPQSVGVTAAGGVNGGTIYVSAAGCAGIASASGSGAPPQSVTITPLGAGTCSVVVVDGIASALIPVSVSQGTTAAAVTVSPSSLTFGAPNAAPQNVTVGFQGSIGQVTVDQTSCRGIAVFTIPNGALPQTGTVTPEAAGSCTVTFTPSTGQAATLAVTVQ